MIYKFSVHRSEGDGAPTHLTRHLVDLRSWREYYVEVDGELVDSQVEELRGAMGDPLLDAVVVGEALAPGNVQVTYRRGIVDNENDSVVGLARSLGVPAIAAKVAIAYSSADVALPTIIEAEACNATIEEIHTAEPHFDSLLPHGDYAPAQQFDLRPLDDDALAVLGKANGRVLDLEQMRKIRDIQVKTGSETVTDALLEALDARWSDHCMHTTWKRLGNLLGKLVDSARQTKNPNIVSMFYDNAGIWDFYDGHGIAIKAETHNGPSAVSAYFGQLTKVGGVLRDILGTGKGADPIGVFEYTATGLPTSPAPIAGRPTSKQIAQETIRAVKEYGNTFGVPMMSSHMTFHDAYRAKPFALGGSIGLIPLEHAQKGSPQPGDLVVIVGGLTGNDGIHGASGSSAGAQMDATSVQIGSPLEEIKFREAIIDLRDAGYIRAVTDMGAAGINSACGEMGEETGIWVNTALVPLKTSGLAMWRILLSESQERMLVAIAPEQLGAARTIFDRHEVRNTVIGRFTDTNRYCVVHDTTIDEEAVIDADIAAMPQAAEVGFDVAYELLDYKPESVQVEPPVQAFRIESEWPDVAVADLPGVVEGLVRDAEVTDQSHASLQYDSSVGGRTVYGPTVGTRRVPTGYYVGRPLYGRPHGLVFSTSFNPWLFDAHPVFAARQHFFSLLARQVLAGVSVTDICLCDNFYTPDAEPDAERWLVAMVHELARLAAQLRTPFISGKDSSAGSTNTDEGIVSVPPAVFLSALGKVPDVAQLRTETWSTPGNLLVQVGVPTPSLAGTAAARIFDREANDVDDLSPQLAYTFLAQLEQLPISVVPSGRIIGNGGVLGATVFGALASGLGAELDVPAAGCVELLQEHRVGALLEVVPSALDELPPSIAPLVVGRIVDRAESVQIDGVELLPASAIDVWSNAYEEALA